MPECYVGRFAPSPTGLLHWGSVYTALASYLDAKACHGLWRLRFDDLDTPRNVSGACAGILKTLEALGLEWDGEVDFQCQHLDDYHAALDTLQRLGLTYVCCCSRKALRGQIYPQTCRDKNYSMQLAHALRFKTIDLALSFVDGLQGHYGQNLAEQGDFILKRKDGIIAYPLAVVMDDARMGITHVVRGVDLLPETIKQGYLQHCLQLQAPYYAHVPVICGQDGCKLSKQTFAQPVDATQPVATWFQLLIWLKQSPPPDLLSATLEEIRQWGVQHWRIDALRGVQRIGLTG